MSTLALGSIALRCVVVGSWFAAAVAIVAPTAIAAAAAQSAATCEPSWVPTFGAVPGTNGEIVSFAVFDDGGGDALYVAGSFTSVGVVQARSIAKWDGTTWSPLGSGILSGVASSMVVFDDGTGPALFVGGGFAGAGGVSTNGVVKWDGHNWFALGSGTDTTVTSLAVYDDGTGPALYAGGFFATAGGVAANHLAKWDGSNWSAVSSGVVGSVYALAVFDDGSGPALYVGGHYSSAGGQLANGIARWNGSSWSTWGGGIGTTPTVASLSVVDDGSGPALYMGGTFTAVNGVPANRLAKWNGSNWSAFGAGFATGFVSSLTVFDDGHAPALIAAGRFATSGGVAVDNIARWDGANWSSVGGGMIGASAWIYALTSFDDGHGARLFAGGTFDSAGGVAALNFASWDGSTWRALASGFNATVRAVCTFDAGSGTELYAGGTFTLGGGVSLKAIGRWNGAAWSPLGSGISTGPNPPSVYAMTVFDDGVAPALYVGGDFSGAGGAVWARRVARWDGSNWSALGLGMNDVVYALTVFDDGGGNALWAGGAFEMINTTYCRFVAKWDGATWTAPYDLGVGEPAASVFALATFDDGSGPALYAGGRFGNAANASGGFFPASNIARWDGSNWFALSSGVDGPVHSLAVFDDGSGPALFVGGTFAHAGGSPALDIAKWTSAGWSAVGSGLNGAVESMHSFDDGSGAALYTGGSFTAAGAVAANRIAKWNGTNWSALGSGTDATVFALTDYDDSSGAALFVGGAFVNASSSGDSFLAKWGCPFVRTGTSYCTSSTTSGGCVPVMSAAGHASTSSSSTFTISVSNLDGQRSGLLFYGIHGQLASPWGAGGTSLLCVKSPTQRMTLHNTSGTAGACDGSLSEDWNAYISSHSSALGSPFTRGDLVWCQAWFRDPPSPKTSALSNGLVFSVGP